MRHWPIAVHSKAPQKISQMRKNHDEYMWIYICICNYMYLYMVPCSIYLFVVSFCNVRTQALQPAKVVSIAKVAPVVSLESWFLHWNSNSENPPKNFPSGKFTNPKEILQNLQKEPVAPLGIPSALPTAATMPLHQCWRAPHCKWGCRTLAPQSGSPSGCRGFSHGPWCLTKDLQQKTPLRDGS